MLKETDLRVLCDDKVDSLRRSAVREFGESQEKPGSGVRIVSGKPDSVNMFWG